jgi:hypothetical protein
MRRIAREIPVAGGPKKGRRIREIQELEVLYSRLHNSVNTQFFFSFFSRPHVVIGASRFKNVGHKSWAILNSNTVGRIPNTNRKIPTVSGQALQLRRTRHMHVMTWEKKLRVHRR